MKSIFISYSENDADEVLSVISALTDEGYSVKYDEEMKGQANLSSAEEEEIENCGVLLAFISESSMGSAKCRNQVNFAISRSKSILSVFLAGATDEDIADMTPYSKATVNRADYSGEYGFIKAVLSNGLIEGTRMGASASIKEKSAPKAAAPKTSASDGFAASMKSAKPYSTVCFGSYPSRGMTPSAIEWIVLEKSCGMALLLSKYVLDCRDFGKTRDWENSDMRAWLNDDFYNTAFNSSEQKKIYTNERFTDTVKDVQKTSEKVFLLDHLEVKKYFSFLKKHHMKGIPTEYALRHGAYVEKKINNWWLRCSHTEKVQVQSRGTTINGITYQSFYDRMPRTETKYYQHTASANNVMSMLRENNSQQVLDGLGIRPAIWVVYE